VVGVSVGDALGTLVGGNALSTPVHIQQRRSRGRTRGDHIVLADENSK
jgi:hypothetical protein